uniref:Uncharacterized protein n=1 Tax=Cucumis melo TaxID=3656 RepID=A0A9I9EHN4_CUCME
MLRASSQEINSISSTIPSAFMYIRMTRIAIYFDGYVAEYKINVDDFEHEMGLMESFTPGIREELESIGFVKWFLPTHHIDPVNKMKYQVIDGTSQYVIYLSMKFKLCIAKSYT